MNLDHYSQLYNYLESDKIPEEFTDYQQKQLINQERYFELDITSYIKEIEKILNTLLEIKWTEVEPILYMMHKHPTAGHLGTDTMYYKIAERYYWDQMYRDIQEYVKTCETCQKRQKGKRKEPLHLIQIGHAFERVGIDLVGPLPLTAKNNRYIIVATDYLTRWPEAHAVPDAGANTLLNLFSKKLSVDMELRRLYSLTKEETLLVKPYGYCVKSFLSNTNSLYHTTLRQMEWL